MSDLHHQRRLATATTRVLRPAQPAPAHHLSALALAAALASLSALPLPAHAQAQPGTERAQTYDIPAGPLEAALTRFAKTSGVLLAYTPELVRDLQSPGLQGSHAPAEALTRLLAGSGLAAATTGNGSYTLRRSQASPAPSTPASAGPVATTTLGEVRVTARAEVGSATEGTGAYTATGPSSTATGLGLSLRETPQSVSVMTRQRMDDF
jgi:outer membrane receptor for ferric coprogen and ferric-rhodotorulic acid